MKTNAEFRNLAWKRLWTDRWFGRLFGGGLLLGLCGYVVQIVLGRIFGQFGVQSWFDYLEIVAKNRQDLTTPVPNLTPEFVSQASSSTVLLLFLSFIMAGIASYGAAVILKKCLANDEQGWLGEAFGGFKNPFGMLWLQLRYWLIFLFWGILASISLGAAIGISIPLVKGFAESNLALTVTAVTVVMLVGVGAAFALYAVPFYRYRFLWLVKAEHPDWSAGACIAASRKLMKGNKMKSFKLDCSYWKPITLAVLLLVAFASAVSATVVGPLKILAGLLAFVSFVGMMISIVVFAQYISVGQGLFYEELKKVQ